MHQAKKLYNKLTEGDLQKIVLSRVICTSIPKHFELGKFFGNLCQKYPNAFVYILFVNKFNCWIGATPELLLEMQDNQGITMSLAGSIYGKEIRNEEAWTKKELDENEFVSKYIMEKLLQSGATGIKEMPMETVAAGPVVHLRRLFRFNIPTNLNAITLSMALHPTPAVCGIPANYAKECILNTEKHSRNYYSGFLGPVSGETNAKFFVNLRCMHIDDKIAYIFTGSGLMPQSSLENEWHETQAKAQTLISVIEDHNAND